MKKAIRLIKNSRILLVITGVIFFTAGLVQAGEVIEEWVRQYNGLGNDYDYALAIAIDVSGNIYVTGTSTGSGTSYDYATIKYDSDGNEIWIRRYDGPGNSYDFASAIAVDDSGNAYVTGQSPGSGTNNDYATIKYDTNGVEQWVRRYNGPGNGGDSASGIAVDGSGNIYVVGSGPGSGTNDDYATIKYDTNGNELWIARYNGQDNDSDYALDIVVEDSCNIYVTGISYGSCTDGDYATIKYDPDGNEIWVRRYNGEENGYDSARAIAIDGFGNVYATGTSYDSGTDDDYLTIKYDTNGNQLWVARYNGPGNGRDEAPAVAADSFGNVYVTGESLGSGTSYDYATIKYDPNGNELWVARYNGPGSSADEVLAMTIDVYGNIYVTGDSYAPITGSDYTIVKYNSSGSELWVARYSGPLDYSDDEARAIVVDDSDNIYVTGCARISSSHGSGYYDYATIKYNQNLIFLTLTMQTEPNEVNSITPLPGDHEYAQGTKANISAQQFVDCPDVYVFDHWEGDVNDPNSANTTVFMDTDKTVTAVFIDGRECGDECHTYPDGDLNLDCEVNFFDMAIIANNWLVRTDPNYD